MRRRASWTHARAVLPLLTAALAGLASASEPGAQLDAPVQGLGQLLEQLDPARVPLGESRYRFVFRGEPYGSMQVVTFLDDDAAVVQRTRVVEAARITEVFTSRLTRPGFRFASFTATGRMRDTDLDVDLVRHGDFAEGYSVFPRGPGEPEGRVELDVELVEPVIERSALFGLLPAMPLAPGQEFTIRVFNPPSGQVYDARFTVGDAGRVTVPAGTFPALEVSLSGGDPSWSFLVHTGEPALLLAARIAGQPMVFELESADALEAGAKD